MNHRRLRIPEPTAGTHLSDYEHVLDAVAAITLQPVQGTFNGRIVSGDSDRHHQRTKDRHDAITALNECIGTLAAEVRRLTARQAEARATLQTLQTPPASTLDGGASETPKNS